MANFLSIGAWLQELGLGEHEALFVDNHIDWDVLAELKPQDLRDLGLPLGHQKRLLRAISELDDGPASTSHENLRDRDGLPPELDRGVPSDGERRHIAVMFCDLVGSTALSEQLDPEDLRTLMQAYQKVCGGAVERYGGHVAQYLGDGIMIYFGWPQAHEDDAERAVRVGRDIIGAIKSIPAPRPLQVHIGIASGMVVIGETGGGDASVPKLAVGETPNLAARLQGVAGPDEVVVAPRSHRLVEGLFEFDDLGPHRLKGIVEPIRGWRVTGERRVEGRFDAAHSGSLAPLIGRDAEIALLMERWRQAKDGEGQVVLIGGEPGIGKSRIISEFRSRIADDRHLVLDRQCSPHHTHTPYYPFIDQAARFAEFGADDPPDRKLDRLEEMIAQNGLDVAAFAPFFANALSIPAGDRYPPKDDNPHKLRERISEAIAARGVQITQRGPVLVLVEDTQWIDPTSEETFTRFIDKARDAATLMIFSHRPEYEPPWRRFSHATSITLNRLGGRQSTAIVANLTGGKALPDAVLEQILEKTDGIPLFVEELTKTVLESGLVAEEDGRYALTGLLPAMAIPATLQDSLMARLDRLAPVKEVAQIGACIGRHFSHSLVQAVSRMPEAALTDALSSLVESELISQEGTPPAASYMFKHALVQDAAQESLLKNRRHQIHADIARTIERLEPDTGAARPELLGHHYAEAALPDRAVPYFLRAGEQATARSANAEAVGHLTQALETVSEIENERQRLFTELEVRVTLGSPLIAAKGFAAEETIENHARTRALSELLDDRSSLFPALYGQCVSHTVRGEHGTARRIAEHFLELSERDGSVGTKLMGHRILGLTQIFLGDFAPGRGHLQKALALYVPERDHALAFRYAQNPGVAAQALLTWVLWLLGHADIAQIERDKALANAVRLEHGQTSVHAVFYAGCMLGYLLREPDATGRHAEHLISLSKERGIWTCLSLAKVLLGWSEIVRGDAESGLRRIEAALQADDIAAVSYNRTLVAAIRAEGLTALARYDDAIDVLAEALGLIAETEEHWLEAELYRLQGTVFRARDEIPRAQDCFRAALDVARDQAAKNFDLRATLALADLWGANGEADKARAALNEIYGWFDEGHGTADLRQAKAMMDAL